MGAIAEKVGSEGCDLVLSGRGLGCTTTRRGGRRRGRPPPAADLVGPAGLQVLALEPDVGPGRGRQPAGGRSLDLGGGLCVPTPVSTRPCSCVAAVVPRG